MQTPTQKSLKKMRDDGYLCQVVEKWNPFARIRQDLFGFIDIVCVKEGETVGVQTTSQDNMLSRKKKILGLESYELVKSAGWQVVVHGWKKIKNKYQVKEEIL